MAVDPADDDTRAPLVERLRRLPPGRLVAWAQGRADLNPLAAKLGEAEGNPAKQVEIATDWLKWEKPEVREALLADLAVAGPSPRASSLTPSARLGDLLEDLFDAHELRGWLKRYEWGEGVERDLMAPASRRQTAQDASEKLVERGLAGPEFFRELTASRPYRAADIEAVARAQVEAPAPRGEAPQSAPSAPLRRRPVLVATVAALVLGLSAWLWGRHAPPCATVDEALGEAGFVLNPGLSARLMPGTVLRVCEPGASGPARLKAPVVWATAADCFASAPVQEANWEIPQHTCGSGLELGLELSELTRWLPALSAHASALRDARLEVVGPHIVSLPEMTLASGFNPACAARLAESFTPPVQASWFQVVREAIVVDGLKLRVRWGGGLDASARLAAEDEAEGGAKAAGLDLKASARDGDETTWEAEGPLVLGWRGATARPKLAGGAAGPEGAGGCP